MSKLQFYIRHQPDFLQDKFILVFKSDAARDYFKHKLKGSYFEEISSESAEHAVRIGINGKTIPFGYTLRLTKEEVSRLSTANWEETAHLLAEGNERLYKERAAQQ
ncbi:hypothetical protein [Virgibacillus kimchii]